MFVENEQGMSFLKNCLGMIETWKKINNKKKFRKILKFYCESQKSAQNLEVNSRSWSENSPCIKEKFLNSYM